MNKHGLYNDDEITIYMHKNEQRLMVYIKATKQVISYPRYIMAKELGRELTEDEEVHHIDGDPLNNDVSNLQVLIKEEHWKLHAEENQKYHDKIMTCPWCGKEFLWTAQQQQRFTSNNNRKRNKNSLGVPFCSKSCAGKYGKQMQGSVSGHYNTRRKLSEEDIRYIRKHYIVGDRNYGGRALARKYNVDYTVINNIVKNKTYTEYLDIA